MKLLIILLCLVSQIAEKHKELDVLKAKLSTVRTEILFRNGNRFSTIGVDQNMEGAAFQAIEKGLRNQGLSHIQWNRDQYLQS